MDDCNIRAKYLSLSVEQKQKFLSTLNLPAFKAFIYNPDFFLFDKQIITGEDWRYCLLRCGRSFGKTFAGSAWIAKKIRSGAKVLGLCGPTYDDVAKVMVPAIQSWFSRKELKGSNNGYNHQTHTLSFINGAKVHCYTSDKEIRGPNLEYLWCDEICIWASENEELIQQRFDTIDMAVRVGNNPQTIITSTPMPHRFFVNFQKQINNKNPIYKQIIGSMFDNPTLPQSFLDAQIAKHGGTRTGRQELYGDLLQDFPGALWNIDLIQSTRRNTIEEIANPPNPLNIRKYNDPLTFFSKFLIGADPATTSHDKSDCWGIIVAALGLDHHIYILEDRSAILSPNDAAEEITRLHKKYRNANVVAESNQGGEMIKYILRTKMPHLNPILVHANKGKITRAQPISVLWEQGRAHIVGNLIELEREMTEYTGDEKSKSPNRLDAMVYAAQYIMLEPNIRPVRGSWMPNYR